MARWSMRNGFQHPRDPSAEFTLTSMEKCGDHQPVLDLQATRARGLKVSVSYAQQGAEASEDGSSG